MKLKPINTEEDYDKALVRLNAIFLAPENTDEFAEAEILVKIIDEYENKNYPIDPSNK